jgi:hypothetical protein
MIAFLFLVVWFVFIAYFCSLPLARRPLRILQRWRVDFAFEFFALVVTIGNQVAGYTAYLLHGLRRLVNSFGDLFFGLRRLGDFLVDLLGACWLRFARPQRRFEVLEEVVVVNEWWVVTIRPQIWDQPGRAQAFTINADARTGVSELHDPLSTRPWRNWLVPAMRIHDGMDQDSLNTANDVRRWWRGQIADERRFTDTPVIDGDTVVLVPSAGSRYCLRVWARMAGGLRQRVQRLTVLERFQQQCPEDYDILVAKRYKRERYLQSGCLSFIPYLERSVERAHRERMMFEVQQFACIIGEDDDEMVPYVTQRSCWNDFLRSWFPARNAIWHRRETARLIRLVRVAKIVVGYTRMQLGTLTIGSALEMRSLRVALGQAIRTLEGRGDIRVRLVDMPFVVDCCMFLIQPDGTVLGPAMY